MTKKQLIIKRRIRRRLINDFGFKPWMIRFETENCRECGAKAVSFLFRIFIPNLTAVNGAFFKMCSTLHKEECWNRNEFKFNFVYSLPHEWEHFGYGIRNDRTHRRHKEEGKDNELHQR